MALSVAGDDFAYYFLPAPAPCSVVVVVVR